MDISFFAEDPFSLNDKAVAAGVTAIVDCGVAPGLSNLLIGRVVAQLDRVEACLIYVGGLPEVRQWPYEYKAVLLPDRRDRGVHQAGALRRERFHGHAARPVGPGADRLSRASAPSKPSTPTGCVPWPRPSTPPLKEKTLRYPGHIEKMAVLRETGFFGTEPRSWSTASHVRPIDLTAALLFPKWKMEPEDVDITVLGSRWMAGARVAGR